MLKAQRALEGVGTIHILSPRHKRFGCGISDHSQILATRLAEAGASVTIHHAAGKGFTPVVHAKAGDLVLLQLSVYGFHIKGVPVWLPAHLKDLKARGVRIVTYFHELWVQWARVSRSAFWLSPVQHYICKQVLANSDRAVFNAEWGYNWGTSQATKPVDYITTFSTIGESTHMPVPWRQRPDKLAVFGNPQARADIYRAIIQVIHQQPNGFQSFDLLDIGQSSPTLATLLAADGPVASHFRQTQLAGPAAPDVAQALLLSSKFGVFSASWEHASKSSVLAAYSAHGVCPVSIYSRPVTQRRARLAPKPDVHYALLQNIDWQTASRSAIYPSMAQAAQSGYQSSQALAALLLQEAAKATLQNGQG